MLIFCSPSAWLQNWLFKNSIPEPVLKKRYAVLTAGSVPELEQRMEAEKGKILELVGGVSVCAWIQPGEGFQILFAQAVIYLERDFDSENESL